MPLRDFGLLSFVCVCGAFNNIISKYVLSVLDVPPLAFATLRFAIVFLVTLPWLLPLPRPRGRVLLVALLMGAGNFALLFMGIETSPASAVAVVSQLNVPMTALLSLLLLGEQIDLRRGIGIALAFVGSMLVMWRPGAFALAPGLLFVAGSAFALSLGTVAMKRLHGVTPIKLQAWVGCSSLWPLALLSAATETGQAQAIWSGGWMLAGALVFSGLVVSVVGLTILFTLINRHEASLVGALLVMAPILTITLSALILHEPMTWRMLAGGGMALTGILAVAVRPEKMFAVLAVIGSRLGGARAT